MGDQVMAKNLVYRNIDPKNRVRDLGKTLASGKPVLDKAGIPAVTVTASADYTVSETVGPYTISGINRGGASLKAQEVTLAYDGTWEFPEADITGLTAAAAENDAKVYITSAGALTSTAGSNTLYGRVDYPHDYDRTRGLIPVQIGA